MVTDFAPKHDRIDALDCLRFVAVAGVVLFHYGFKGPLEGGASHTALPQLAPFAQYGYLGVSAFFVISGFAIAYSAEGRSAVSFAIARFSRIYPCFLFCMTLTCLATLVIGGSDFQTGLRQWAANLLIAATAVKQPYVDSAYWSLVIEVIFYGWVTLFIALGVFSRNLHALIFTWLCISILNEATIDSSLIDKILITDHSGFFATGVMLYELRKRSQSIQAQALFAFSIATALYQSIHNLDWLHHHYAADANLDPWIVASICLMSILVIMWATTIKRFPVPSRVALAIGGVTYPLYLLHQKVGYVVLNWLQPSVVTASVVFMTLAGLTMLAWVVWSIVDRPAQRAVKERLSALVRRLGFEGASGHSSTHSDRRVTPPI